MDILISGLGNFTDSTVRNTGQSGDINPIGHCTFLQITYSRSGSANSTTKSLNGSIQSDLSAVDDFDGDNINVVVRVRPLNEKELKAGDPNAIQFPGDGGIWVSIVSFFC